MTDLMERVQREDQEWLAARLHFRIHGNWLGKDECSTCLGLTYPESPYLKLTGWARDHLSVSEYEALAVRAESLNARVGALYSSRRSTWVCTAETPERRVELRGHGPLAAVLAGLLDDLEEAIGA